MDLEAIAGRIASQTVLAKKEKDPSWSKIRSLMTKIKSDNKDIEKSIKDKNKVDFEISLKTLMENLTLMAKAMNRTDLRTKFQQIIKLISD